jgi:hypothetical protein
MFKYYITEPLSTLVDWWPVQGGIALLVTVISSIFCRIVEGYEVLLAADDWLILGAATMFVLDLISGVFGTFRYDHISFRPSALKRSGFKAIEWGIIITGSVVLAGAAREQGIFLIDQVHIGAIFWLMTTDFISMIFNLKGSDTHAMISGMTSLAEGDVGEFIGDVKDAAEDGAVQDSSTRANGDAPEQDGS